MRTDRTLVFRRSVVEDEPSISPRVAILRFITEGRGRLTLTDLAEKLDVHASTVRDHVRQLQGVRALQLDEDLSKSGRAIRTRPRLLRHALTRLDDPVLKEAFGFVWRDWVSGGMERSVDVAWLVDAMGLQRREVIHRLRRLEELEWVEIVKWGSSEMRVVPSVYALANHFIDEAERVPVEHVKGE